MYDAKQSANDSKTLLKIGYMSTVNIQQIVSRYATGCGQNIIVYQFLDSEPKEMETKFKKHFRAHHVELEFYDASHHYKIPKKNNCCRPRTLFFGRTHRSPPPLSSISDK